jgi:hypothetical protein
MTIMDTTAFSDLARRTVESVSDLAGIVRNPADDQGQ